MTNAIHFQPTIAEPIGQEPQLVSDATKFQNCQASDAAQRQEVSEIMQALSEVMTFKSSPLALARGEK